MIWSDQRAVSETLGYAMVLGIVLSFIGICYGIYLPHLAEMQRWRYLQNMEHAFFIFGDNLDRVISGESPARDLQLRLAGGSLTILGQGWINLSWRNSTDHLEWRNFTKLYTFIFRLDGSQVVYQSGAVFSISGLSMIPLKQPKLIWSSGEGLISVITTDAMDSIAGEGIFWVELESPERAGSPWELKTQGYERALNISKLNISLSSDYCLGWRSLLNLTFGIHCGDCLGGEIHCSIPWFTGNLSILGAHLESRLRA